MGSCVSLQIKSVIESLATEGAEVALGVAVALHVPVEQTLEAECFATHSAGKLAGVSFTSQWGKFLHFFLFWDICNHWILDAMTSIDQFKRSISRDSKL